MDINLGNMQGNLIRKILICNARAGDFFLNGLRCVSFDIEARHGSFITELY